MEPPITALVATFHHVVSEQSGNDVTIARAKSMLALAGITWPELGIVVKPRFFGSGRMVWESEAFSAVSMGGSFRRDPVGDDASIIFDEEPEQLVMLKEMEECASFIPLFGRQRLERFNNALAKIYQYKEESRPLPVFGNDNKQDFEGDSEYRRLITWLFEHGSINAEGVWP